MKLWKRKNKLLLGALLFFPLSMDAAKIAVQVNCKPDNKPVVLYLPDGQELSVVPDDSGKALFKIDNATSVYVQLGYYYGTRTLWLTPDADLQITFEGKQFNRAVTITGTGSEPNRYLNSGALKSLAVNDAGLDEEAYMQRGDSLLQANRALLRTAALGKTFGRIEERRLIYFTYGTLPSYPYFHARIAQDTAYRPSERYWQTLRRLADEPSLLALEEYRNFLGDAVGRLARKAFPQQSRMDAIVSYVKAQIKDPATAEYLIYDNLYTLALNNGLESVESYRPVFDTYVKSPRLKARYDALCDKWRKLSAGAPSPDFRCTDISGKEFSLADFRGKYLYIDIWATWCGPCQREIPFLQKLEEKYHDKDITFISISCDADRTVWEKRVKAGLKGMQLHFVAGNTFINEYMISGIPRFILLDKEGKIISADMSRPSDSRTVSALDKLLN